jgi:hypothetical protein
MSANLNTDAAYPRLKAHPTAIELDEIYTPNLFEMDFAEERTRQPAPRVGLLLLSKTFQRQGYFVPYAEIPPRIVSHIARCAGYSGVLEGMVAYDAITARDHHIPWCGPSSASRLMAIQRVRSWWRRA